MINIFVLSLLMMLVTASSRILPIFFLNGKKLPPFAESFLYYVPFAILGALIFPDVLTATGNSVGSAAGAITSLILAWLGKGILVVLFGGIFAAFITAQFIF